MSDFAIGQQVFVTSEGVIDKRAVLSLPATVIHVDRYGVRVEGRDLQPQGWSNTGVFAAREEADAAGAHIARALLREEQIRHHRRCEHLLVVLRNTF